MSTVPLGARPTTTNGKIVQEHFPDIWMELQNEIYTAHPKLVERLKMLLNAGDSQIELWLTEVMTYCGIYGKGTLTPLETDRMAELCLRRLEAIRKS